MINLWIKLTRREKYYVSMGVALVIAFLFLLFVLFPFFGVKGKIKRSIQAKEKALKEVLLLSSEYKALRRDSKDVQKILAQRPKNFTLFSFLEKQADRAGIKSNMKYMKPSTSASTGSYSLLSVEVRLETITLRQIVQYLYFVESPNNLVKVKRISVKQDKGNPEYLTALIHFVTYK